MHSLRHLAALGMLILSVGIMPGCRQHKSRKFERKMELLARNYLAEDSISGYDSLKINSIDTITELGYAKIMYELLENMEAAYRSQYDRAARQSDGNAGIIELYLNEITRTKLDFYDLMNHEGLKTDGVLLWMVSGSYRDAGRRHGNFMFFVSPDSLALYTPDPFGDNLLYR